MRTLVTAALLVGLAGPAVAADEKADPTGTWKWTVERGGQTREQQVKLKLEGGKLTGTMPGRDGAETKIENATFKDGEVSFTVTREFNNNKVTTKYTGKITGDTLKGKMERERDGEKTSTDFEAKRDKTAK